MSKRIAICMTTIFPIGPFLRLYRENIQKFGREREVTVYITGDNKSPACCVEEAAEATRAGLRTNFYPIASQKDYLRRFDGLEAMIPENSDNRRNVAYLMALEEGADMIISVDDDNYPMDDADFVGEHGRIGQTVSLPEATGQGGWYNLCDLLEPKIPDLYPRGFPYWARDARTNTVSAARQTKLGMNVGLWKGDPDSDAIARLYCRPRIEGFDRREVVLGRGVRLPDQHAEHGAEPGGDGGVLFHPHGGCGTGDEGGPLRRHLLGVLRAGVRRRGGRRCPHRLAAGRPSPQPAQPAGGPLPGVGVHHDPGGPLQVPDSVRLPGESYAAAYRSLAGQMEDFVSRQEGFVWQNETREFFRKNAANMRVWVDVVESFR